MEIRGTGGLQGGCTPKDSRGAPQAPRARTRPGVAVALLEFGGRARGPRRAPQSPRRLENGTHGVACQAFRSTGATRPARSDGSPSSTAPYYHAHWGFSLFFEAKVATELAAFLGRYDEQHDGFWTASADGRIEGSITIDGSHAAVEGAHLRWFVMSDARRGQGVGNRLIDAAIGFCRSRGDTRVYLWTFEGLDAARHLYEKNGFRLAEQQRGTSGVARSTNSGSSCRCDPRPAPLAARLDRLPALISD
jgi:GNAT superfamily N-acetyltransferase